MFWRLMAQRKLVLQKRIDAIPLLIELARDGGVDDIGSNPGVIHALWTLHGLGQVTDSNAEALTVAKEAVRHRSAAVRKNAVRVLPKTSISTTLLSGLLDEKDPNTLRQILLTLSSMPQDDSLGEKIYAIRDRIPTGEGLTAPYQLALIRHGSSLVERLISQLPSRERAKEGKVEKKEVELVNMLKNPSFEESKDGLPLNWISKVHRKTATLSIDSSLSRSGKNSGRIESKEGGGAEFLMVRSVEPGEYLLSAWVRTKDIEGKNGVLLKVQGRGLQSKESAKLKGTINEWQKLQINFRVDSQSGVLVFCLFGAWSEAKGTVWFDDVELFQLSSDKVIPKVTKVESLLAKQAFEKRPEAMIKLVELINTKDEKSSSIFMEGLNDLTDISLDAKQTKRLKVLADDAAPANKMALAIFASNNQIDLGLTELANSLTGFEAEILTGNADRGKALASSCISCHGNDFTGMVSERSPSLPQLSDWYMQSQMQKFKHNVRGYEVTDSDGNVMKALMQNYSHQQMADMVAYIRTFKSKEQTISLGGDPVKGKTHYQTCIACHQVDGKGNKLVNSPSLLGHSDLYVYNQLIKFRNGHRGNGSGDKAGKIMQMSSKILPDDQAIKDLAAYLTTLK
jgi:cytochrome c553